MSGAKIRIPLALVAFASALFLPPWVCIVCAVLLCLLFRAWEVVLLGVIIDFLWQPGLPFHAPIATIAAVCILWIFEPLRSELFHSYL